MQPAFAFKPILLLLGFMGGFGLPLGVPPLPETQLLSKIAPEECLFYASSSGMATPDLSNPNQTEQLLAEPAVQKMAADIEKMIKTNLNTAMVQHNVPSALSGDELVDAVKLLLTRPMAIYISDVQINPEGPNVRGAAAVKVGEDSEKIKAKLEQALGVFLPIKPETVQINGDKFQSLKPAPNVTITWGFKKSFFLLAIGEGEMESLLKRASGNAPQWLTKIRQELPVERVSTVSYINVKAISKSIFTVDPQAWAIIEIYKQFIGISNVNNIASVAGLNQSGYVKRIHISIEGEPQGLMQFASIKPLSVDDLSSIPADATIALAAKINFQAVFDTLMATVQKADSQNAAAMAQSISQVESQFGLKLREDILGSLGDNVILYSDIYSKSTPMEARALLASIQLKNPEQAAKSYAKIIQILESVITAMGKNNPNAAKLTKESFSEKQIAIYTLKAQPPTFPPISWCLTEKELIISASSKGIQSFLSRSLESKALSQSPDISKIISSDSQPTAFFYLNTKQTFDAFYPMLPMLAPMIQQQGINLDLSMLPPQEAIGKHLTPMIATVHRTKYGIEITEHSPLPGVGITQASPMTAALLLPAVQSSRTAAQRVASMNNMRQIMLAMHNYHDAQKRFPPAYKADKSGKPLLSWRVLILPYLEYDALYKEFHLDEPWDSEHNKQLIAKMPPEYISPAIQAGGGKTNYLTIRGKNSIFPGEKGVRVADITDGTAFTIALVEASNQKAVPWTKPADFEYGDANPLQFLGGLYPNVFLAAFADGSVRALSISLDPEVLKGLFSRDGAEVVQGKF